MCHPYTRNYRLSFQSFSKTVQHRTPHAVFIPESLFSMTFTSVILYYVTTCDTVKREYLAAIIFGGFSNMAIWRRINLAFSNDGISKDWDVFI